MNDPIRHQLDLELENLSLNQLNDLGNQAVNMGLIAGHGYHKSQYEIIRQGQIHTMTPRQALDYLQQLIRSVSG